MKLKMEQLERVAILLAILAITGCGHHAGLASGSSGVNPESSTIPFTLVDSRSLILLKHEGASATDEQIRRFQEKVRAGRDRKNSLEHLGWLFVTKARESFDTGYYKLAEACADVMNADSPGCAEAMLLRGHVLQNLHRFKEAEPIARDSSADADSASTLPCSATS